MGNWLIPTLKDVTPQLEKWQKRGRIRFHGDVVKPSNHPRQLRVGKRVYESRRDAIKKLRVADRTLERMILDGRAVYV